MSKNKIIYGGEINLFNLFQFIWVNKLGATIVFLLSFLTIFFFNINPNKNSTVSIQLTKVNLKFQENYIFINNILGSFKNYHYTWYNLENFIFNNFEKTIKNQDHIETFFKNNNLNKDNFNLKFLKLDNNKYELSLQNDDNHKSSIVLTSFVDYSFIKSKNRSINELEKIFEEIIKIYNLKNKNIKLKKKLEDINIQKLHRYISYFKKKDNKDNKDNLDKILEELKKFTNLRSNNLDLNMEKDYYINILKKIDINELFIYNPKRAVITNGKNNNFFSFFKIMIASSFSAIIYLVVVRLVNLRRKNYDN